MQALNSYYVNWQGYPQYYYFEDIVEFEIIFLDSLKLHHFLVGERGQRMKLV